MGPEDSVVSACQFSERIPPSFNGISNYQAYRSDVILWCQLTSLDPIKQGAALIGQLSCEAKHLAKNLPIEVICSTDGVQKLLSRLDDSYATDASDLLDQDLSEFMLYTWEKSQSIDQYIVGFNARLDKVEEVKFSDKVKGHMMLRQACLDTHERSVIIGAASGRFEVKHISTALRTTYREHCRHPSTMNTQCASPAAAKPHSQPRYSASYNPSPVHTQLKNPYDQRPHFKIPSKADNSGASSSGRPTFLSNYKSISSFHSPDLKHMAILDSGACASIVGKTTLDNFMRCFNIKSLPDADKRQSVHRFGQHPQEYPTIQAVKVPFNPISLYDSPIEGFDIAFDVIEGDLPFLIGLPSLSAMGATINFHHMNLGLMLQKVYRRFKLFKEESHIFLPLSPQEVQVHRPYHSSQRGAERATPPTVYYTPTPHAATLVQSVESNPLIVPDNNTVSLQEPDNPHQATVAQSDENMHERTPDDPEQLPQNTLQPFNLKQLKKLHLQLRHGSLTDMVSYLKRAKVWNERLRPALTAILNSCPCLMASAKPSHPVISRSPPMIDKQTNVAVDIVKLGPQIFMHVVDKATGWSEVALLHSKSLQVQCKTFHKMQTLRHGPPKTIAGDQEYNHSAFLQYCDSINAKFIAIPANAHEGNGSVERANKTLRTFYNRLRVSDARSPNEEIVNEATYGKNIGKGTKICSSFELLYAHPPRIMDDLKLEVEATNTVANHSSNVASSRIRRALRSSVRRTESVKIGDSILFWRDKDGWLGPVKVEYVDEDHVKFLHNGYEKTASLAYIKRSSLDMTRIDDLPEYTAPWDMATHNECIANPESIQTNATSELIEHTDQDTQVNQASDAPYSAPEPHTDEIPPSTANPSDPDSPSLEPLMIDAQDDEDDPDSPSLGPLKINAQNDDDNPDDSTTTASPKRAPKVNSRLAELQREASEYINNPHLTSYKMKPLPPRNPITDHEKAEAFQKEKQNWVLNNAFVEVERSSVQSGKNIIGSHVLFKRRDDHSVKARIVPWGHRDLEKNDVRGDAPTMNIDAFRLVFSIAAENNWSIGQMDAKAAYLQAKGFHREIYVKPPREDFSTKLWKLTAAAYGLRDSGRLWYLTSDHALIMKHGLRRSRTENALYYSQHDNHLAFVLVTQVDNYIYTGTAHEMSGFETFLQTEFMVGELDRRSFSVMGCSIEQHHDNSITVTQPEKMADLSARDLCSSIRDREAHDVASPSDISLYKSVIGQMLFVGRLTHPPLLYFASHMATKTSNLRIHHLRELSAIVKTCARTPPRLLYKSIDQNTKNKYLSCYSDAAMCNKNDEGARGGFIISRRFDDVTHPIAWSAKKLRRVARSSATAELLAAADATSHTLYLQTLIRELYHPNINISARLTLDSLCLYRLATSTREPQEAYNKIDLAAIRQSFNTNQLDTIQWQPGSYHIADSLTKNNPVSTAHMLKTLREGTYPVHPDTLVMRAEEEYTIQRGEPSDGGQRGACDDFAHS